jgi:Tfp pilus assembly pilus retraction ATPase PilT
MAKIIREFKELDIEDTKRSFFNYLDGSNKWFGDMLYDVKINYINKGAPVSDIQIRQDEPIRLSLVKSTIIYIPPKIDGVTERRRNPTVSEIRDVTLKFINKDDTFDWESFIGDFSFSVEGLGVFRVNYSTSMNGAVLTMRILSHELPSFGYVGYPRMYQEYITSLMKKSHVRHPGPERDENGETTSLNTRETLVIDESGLILHVGPTGSGKTTGIAAEFGYIAESASIKMVTFENPIEYRYKFTMATVEQYELGVNVIKDDKASRSEMEVAQRLFLRATAPVALIGEARNNDEIKILVDIASRGHLVFSTIHAMTVIEAIANLMSAVGENRQLLAQSLKAIVAHKLIQTNKGEVIGIHEIIILNSTIRNYIEKGDLNSIFRVFYNESGGIKKQLFKESLDGLLGIGKISTSEYEDIIENNSALFFVQKKEISNTHGKN